MMRAVVFHVATCHKADKSALGKHVLYVLLGPRLSCLQGILSSLCVPNLHVGS